MATERQRLRAGLASMAAIAKRDGMSHSEIAADLRTLAGIYAPPPPAERAAAATERLRGAVAAHKRGRATATDVLKLAADWAEALAAAEEAEPAEEPLPDHPTCGVCGVRRDEHAGVASHVWQWTRPAATEPPPADGPIAVGDTRTVEIKRPTQRGPERSK